MPSKKSPLLSIVIPVFNEGNNLKVLLPVVEALVLTPHEVLIAHDIPDDTSVPVVNDLRKKYPSISLVHNTLGRGVINAVKSGVANAKGDYVLIIAADDLGPVLAIEDMVLLMGEGCDLVNATRYAHGGKNVGGVFLSRLLSTVANRIFALISGSRLSDPTFGVKMFSRKKFQEITLVSRPIGWAFSFEFALKAQAAGWRLGEVPLISLNRLYGDGKSSFRLNWIREYMRWFLFGIMKLHKKGIKQPRIRLSHGLSPK